MCQLQAPAQLLLFSLTLCARPSSIRASSASPTPKVDELPEGGIKGIECWGILSTSQYMVNTFGYISESTYMVPSTGKNKTRLRLDQLVLSLLRGLHVCFVSFEGLTHAKQRKVADWKHQTPIQPNTKLPRAALVVAAWARPAPPAAPAHTCNHRPSPINDG